MKFRLLMSSMALANLAMADGNLYILPQYSYGISVLDSNIMPVDNVNIGMLYQFESSILLVGGRIGYYSGTSDNYYIPQNASSYNKVVSAPYAAVSFGTGLKFSNLFRNNILLNLQYSPNGNYGINCSSNSEYCQTQLGKSFSAFGFGIENQLFYNLSSDISIGATTGIMFNISQLSNYASVSGASYSSDQRAHSAAPYVGLIMSYKVF